MHASPQIYPVLKHGGLLGATGVLLYPEFGSPKKLFRRTLDRKLEVALIRAHRAVRVMPQHRNSWDITRNTGEA